MSKELEKLLNIGSSSARLLEKQLNDFKEGRSTNIDLNLLLSGGVFNLKSSTVRMAMFVDGQPADEATYVNAVLEAYKNGSIPQEMGIYMQELAELEREHPEKFNLWKAAQVLPTKFEGGANTAVNKRIADAGGVIGDTKYDEKLANYQDNHKIAYVRTPYTGDPRSTFVAGVRGYHENAERFELEQRQTFAVHAMTPEGTGVLIEGRLRVKNGELVFHDSSGNAYKIDEFVEKSHLNPDLGIAAEGDVGHVVAESTQTIRKALSSVKKLRGANLYGPSVEEYLKTLETHLTNVYREAVANDKLFFKTPFPNGSDRLKEQYSILLQQAAYLGHDQVLIVEETKEGTWSHGTLTVPFNYSVGITVSEFRKPNQNWKGTRSKILLNNARSLLTDLANASMVGSIFKEGSSSPFTNVMLRSLYTIFGDKDFLKAITRRKARKTVTSKKTPRAAKRQDTKKVEAEQRKAEREIKRNIGKLRKQVLSQKINFTRLGRIKRSNLQLVPLLNAEIEQEVLAGMTLPSLQSRTGRFASSVRITSAEHRAITYTYRKSPYQVFSMSEGRSPWATRERDPNTIITNAIKRLAYGKYQQYFKDPLVIKEG